ncbi:MAG TPA: methyltransferase domain-containing protein [Burkholderiales bacterium]|nr:methyltransferase domain-containing protein [Burkholderiales bacterium]
MPSDSSAADFWDTRFRTGVTPWDAGGVPAHLESWFKTRPPGGSKVLVPGCGTGYEIALFARHGDDVLGIDFSQAALEAARRYLGAQSRLVRQADFFAFEEGSFDFVYERAFLCALPRVRWSDWARRMSELVRPGGELAGFFYLDDNERGPPFGTSREGLHRLLDRAFLLREDKAIPPQDSLAVFAGKEIWQRWERRL